MIQRILLPLDGYGDNRQQIRYGKEMAASMGAELCLLHIAARNRHGHRSGWLAKRAPEVSARMLPAHTLDSGRVDLAIASYARLIDADLILLPTRGRGWIGQMVFGSTTMDVLRIANRPLWVAKPKAVLSEQPVRCKRILCGVAIGSEGESVLRYAARLAKVCRGELLIVHAEPEISEAMLLEYGLDDSGEIDLRPSSARRRICSMAASLDVPYRVEAKIGNVAAVVRKFAKQWRADVVVVGRGRRTDRLEFGANVGDIIARSACPVITVPAAPRVIREHGRQVGRLATLPTAPQEHAFVDRVPLAVAV